MKHHILFDLDGTLTDPMVGITSSVQYALARFGIEVKYLKELTPFIGPPLTESFERFYGFDHGQAVKAVEYYREYFSPRGIYENEIYPGIPEMLEDLTDAGFSLYLASSKPTVFVERILDYFGIRGYFSGVCGSELDGTRVDKKEVVSHVLWTWGIPAADAIMVGDRRHDVEGARACGLLSVGVLYGYGSEDELKKAGASQIAASVEELKDCLLRQDQEIEEERSLIRFAIAGTGQPAEKFYQANRFSRGFELTAVYEPDQKRAEEFCFRKGQLQTYDTIDGLCQAEEVDAVFICGPVLAHYEQAAPLMRAGKHVLCMAPLAMDESQARELFDIADQEKVILMEAQPWIYTPGFVKMQQNIRSLGEVRRATFQHCVKSPDYDSYRRGIEKGLFNPGTSAGALMELGICPLTCMVSLFGRPDRVRAAGIGLGNGINVSGSLLLGYKEMTGEVLYSALSRAAVPSQIQGEDAAMLIREIDNVKDVRIFRDKVNQTIHFEQSDNILNHVTGAFMQAVRTGKGWEKSRQITLDTMSILDQAAGEIEQKDQDQAVNNTEQENQGREGIDIKQENLGRESIDIKQENPDREGREMQTGD